MNTFFLIHIQDTSNQTSKEYKISKEQIRIGRNPINDLQLDFPFVSQYHAALEVKEGEIWIRDLGSKNGIILPGKGRLEAFQPTPLDKRSSHFAIGPLVINMRLENASSAVIQASFTFPSREADKDETPLSLDGEKSLSCSALKKLFSALAPEIPFPQNEESISQWIRHTEKILSTFFKYFLSLQEGYLQWEKLLHLPPITTPEQRGLPWLETKNPLDLGNRVLDWRQSIGSSIQAIEKSFEGMMIHQVALLQGIRGGIRSLLDELSPEQIEQALDVIKEGGGLKIGPYRYKNLWHLFNKMHAELTEDEQKSFEIVIGHQFQAAYAQLVHLNEQNREKS